MMVNQASTAAKNRARSTAAVTPARLAAFKILRRVEEEHAFASVLLASQERDLQANDRALCQTLVMGVLQNRLWLDRLIVHYSNRQGERLDPAVQIALRLGLYQLRFLSRVPASAAVNESVKLARVARLRSAEGLVNAVLRRATREPDYDPVAEISDPLERIAVETSHPPWLIERWAKAFGLDEAAALGRADNVPAPLAFRVLGRANEAAIIDALISDGSQVTSSKITPHAWCIAGPTDLFQSFAREGVVYIQGEASQLVAHLVKAREGDLVFDVCAAPGSKSTHIADLTNDRALVVSGDLHQHRLLTLKNIAAQQGLASLRPVKLNGLEALPFPRASFDRVLVDAPCTGTGTLQRNPEIRWRISPADIEDLSARQIRILLNASEMVKVGGRLVYSTCSVEPEENEQVLQQFFEKTRGFSRIPLPVRPSHSTSSGTIRLWPHRDGTDGFVIAAFERQA